MAAYYTDHNVAVGIAHLLRAEGHNVVTARDLGLDHARDDEHLLVAAQQARIFISHNRADFELLHHAWHHWSRAWGVTVPHAGILIMPQTLPPFRLAQEVNAIQKTGVSFVNALYEWRSSSGWTRR